MNQSGKKEVLSDKPNILKIVIIGVCVIATLGLFALSAIKANPLYMLIAPVFLMVLLRQLRT